MGNNRIVADASGEVVQSNEYYPFGLLMATSTEADKQPYKYGNKELDSYNGLNWYDFEARYLDSGVPSFTTQDPLAEKYYSISPYAYVANNPLKFIDPTGRDIRLVNVTHRNRSGKLQSERGLSRKTEAAMRDFMKTSEGRAFFGQFAKAGDVVGGHTFKEDGKLSNHTINVFDYSHSKETGQIIPSRNNGSIGVKIDKNGKATVNLKLSSLGRDKNDIGETITHETQLHGTYIGDEIGGKTISTEKQDHSALKNKDNTHQGYNNYNSVRGKLEKIDEGYKKTFKDAEEYAKKIY